MTIFTRNVTWDYRQIMVMDMTQTVRFLILKDLRKYLLIHGTGDDNVHVQNSMRMVESLVQADKDFDWFAYPDKNHGIYGGNTTMHLYRMMTKFIADNL